MEFRKQLKVLFDNIAQLVGGTCQISLVGAELAIQFRPAPP